MYNRIKGTQDFLDMTRFNFIIDTVKKHLSLYRFTEIQTPILEPCQLYIRSLGTETDVVTKEMYKIATHSEDDEGICLRPEGTASIVRAFIDNHITEVPWKVFSVGPMFRYERPQKGRYRQFHQITAEVLGSQSIEQDVQFIKMLDRYFFETLKFNNYALMINFLGCHDDRARFKKELDVYLDTVIDAICGTCRVRKEKNIMRVFDCKNPECKELYVKAPQITQFLCESCGKDWQALKDNLEQLSVSYSHNPYLVRGLDYYSKTVFEFVSGELGAQNAFCGGGRYDQLAKDLGAKQDVPSMGAAIGLERIMLMLEALKNGPALPVQPPLYVFLPMAREQYALALMLADELQAQQMATDVFLEGDSLKSMMRKANKLGAKYALILGENEQKERKVMVKNMITSQEDKILQKDLVSFLKQ